MKTRLAVTENATFALRWTHADWLREGFGVSARFCIYVAECDEANVGMVIYSERAYTGWREPALYIQDLFVELGYRRHGIGRALFQAAAQLARTMDAGALSIFSEPASEGFYLRLGALRIGQIEWQGGVILPHLLFPL